MDDLIPITRIELYLAKIAGMNVSIPEPVTRTELFLAKIAGIDVEVPTPTTRTEIFLSEWANGGGDKPKAIVGIAKVGTAKI